jgi:hypothetical protein
MVEKMPDAVLTGKIRQTLNESKRCANESERLRDAGPAWDPEHC